MTAALTPGEIVVRKTDPTVEFVVLFAGPHATVVAPAALSPLPDPALVSRVEPRRVPQRPAPQRAVRNGYETRS